MRLFRALGVAAISSSSVVLAFACGHEEQPPATPAPAATTIVAIDKAPATTPAPSASVVPKPASRPTPTMESNDPDSDPLAAKGNMRGDAIGDAFGAGGLGLSGEGGTGEGIGLGNIGTLGSGYGTADGGARFKGPTPSLRQGTTTVNGRLPPEVIQRIVRQNFGRFRLCYEKGLKKDASLKGTVTTKFTIDKSGDVTGNKDDGSTLADKEVVKCIVGAFAALSFPQPEGGVVTVSYPIICAPGDPAPAKKN